MRSLLLGLVCLVVVSTGCHMAIAEEFTPLFDGKTLQGWEGDLKLFHVNDGAIVGGSMEKGLGHNEFLCTKREYKNFELRLKCKLVGNKANGGIQFRSQRVPNSREMKGYQADMDENWWGNLYDESNRNKILAGPTKEERVKIVRPNDWNDYVIRCEGRHVQIWLNGTKTVDFTETDRSASESGLIGLQIHAGGPSQAWYKDIRIEELPAK